MKLLNIRITGTRPTADERDTARRVVQGDAAAMKALYDQSAGKLTATCARYVTDEDDLHDVLQEAYIKIFTRMDRFEYRGKGSLEAWMKRIAINEALKFLRGKDLLVPLDDEADKWLPCDEPPAVEDVPLDVLQDMIRRLPSGQRTVFNLYVFEGKATRKSPPCYKSARAPRPLNSAGPKASWLNGFKITGHATLAENDDRKRVDRHPAPTHG